MEITIRDEFIKLGQALKLAGLVDDGVQAKIVITEGLVKVNGEVDLRRGRKRVSDRNHKDRRGKERRALRLYRNA